MPEVSIINAQVGIVILDTSDFETHEMEAEITRYPVEDGADNSDHVRELPEKLTLTGTVTNHPLRFNTSGEPASPISTDVGPVDDRAEAALSQLREYKSAGARLDCVTGLRDYQNMSIAKIVVSRDKTTGNILDLTVNLEEVPVAETEQVSLPVPTKKANKKKTNKGKTSKEAATGVQGEFVEDQFGDLVSEEFGFGQSVQL